MLRALLFAAAFAFLPPGAAAENLSTGLYANSHYDVRANPYRDLEHAIARASAENKRVLIVVGGDWCTWCEVLDRFLEQNADVHAAFEESFVVLKVNWSSQNTNAAFLSGFPESVGFPDFFILDGNGAFRAQQDTGELESGRSYSRARMLAFARRWRQSEQQ